MNIPEHRKEWSIYAAELPDFWDRTKVPSVSQVLAFKFGGPPDVPNVHIALDRGQKIHRCLQYLDERDLHLESIKGSELEQYVATWGEWTRAGTEWLAIEKPLWGTLAGINYIVRPDRVMKRGGKVCVVDIKTKSKVGRDPTADERRNHALEVAAQRVAVAQRLGPMSDWTGCAYLWPDKLKTVAYGAAQDIDAFAALLVEWAAAQEQRDEEQQRIGLEENQGAA